MRGALAWALPLLLVAAVLVEVAIGAVAISPLRLLDLALGAAPSRLEAAVLGEIRLPRALLAVAVGAGLGMAGAAQQGLFRNPLADPALIGVSSGAALAAVAAIVLGRGLFVPLCAFAGGLAATLLALRLAGIGEGSGRLLLAGIAVNAICGAGTGMLITMSDDRQLRDITFWTMGSLANGGWAGAWAALAAAGVAMALLWPQMRALDALLLGEREAAYLGIRVDRLRLRVVAASALAVGAAVAATGIIGFVGLVVPHLIRMAGGARHAVVLPGAAAGGAILLLLADTGARTLAAPAELPVGLVTAALGGPFFVMLLLRQGRAA